MGNTSSTNTNFVDQAADSKVGQSAQEYGKRKLALVIGASLLAAIILFIFGGIVVYNNPSDEAVTDGGEDVDDSRYGGWAMIGVGGLFLASAGWAYYNRNSEFFQLQTAVL